MTDCKKNNNELTCKDAYEVFSSVENIPFCEYMTDTELEKLTSSANKGKVGQLMEILIGKELDSEHLDFPDGELKCVTTDENGVMPSGQSIFVTNIGKHVDDMLDLIPFQDSWVHEKTKHMVLVGICYLDKDDASTWFITCVYDCDFQNDSKLTDLYTVLESEYDELCLRTLDMVVDEGHMGGCAKGLNYVEHRPKNAGTTVSALCGNSVIYDKVKAIYLKRGFFNDIVQAFAA